MRRSNLTTWLLYLGAALLLAYCAYDYVALLSEFMDAREGCRFDDAYMFVRYADNLSAGHGMSWNREEPPTYGATSLPYVLIVALARAIGTMPMEQLISVISALVGLLAVICLFGACRAAAQPSSPLFTAWLGALVIPAVLLMPPFRYHLLTGMDTTLALLANALLLWAVAAMVSRPRLRAYVLVAVAGYVTYLVRPDNGIYGVLCPALAVLLLLPGRRRVTAMLAVGMTLAGLLVADTLIKVWQFGDPFPNGYYAKQLGYYASYAGHILWNPIQYLQTFMRAGLPFVILLVLGAGRRDVRWLIVCVAPMVLTFSYFFGVTQVMGYEARLYYPALPFLVVPSVHVLGGIVNRKVRPGHWGVRLAGLALLVVGIQVGLTGLGEWYEDEVLAKRFDASRHPPVQIGRPVPPLGLWRSRIAIAEIAFRCPPGTVVAASEVGYLAARGRQTRVIDLVGLNDRRIAREGVSLAQLLEREVDLIWMPHEHYRAIHRGILADPAFSEHFDYLPGAYNFGLAIRRDSPRYRQVMQVVRESWRRRYRMPLEHILIPAHLPEVGRGTRSVSPRSGPGRELTWFDRDVSSHLPTHRNPVVTVRT